MDDFFERRTFKSWIKDNQVGIYITIIFHLLIFLLLSVNAIRLKARANFIMIELTHQTLEEPEKTEEELLAEKEALERELDELLKTISPPSSVNLPNIAVNQANDGSESGTGMGIMSGDKKPAPDRTEMKREENPKEKPDDKTPDKTGVDDINTPASQNNNAPKEEYKGPSILSYFLEGRYGTYMPVPAYKCLRGGDVVVLIDVNRQGYVTSVEIDKKRSSSDECIRDAALQAALISRFSPSPQGLASQRGNIIYRFIPQTN
jgi:TonB family protein